MNRGPRKVSPVTPRRVSPALLLLPTLLLAGPGHDHAERPHGAEHPESHSDHHDHAEHHGHDADPHGVVARFGGEVFEAKGHHFEVVLREKILHVIPRDAHTHETGAVQGKVLVQVEGIAPVELPLSPRKKTEELPPHFVTSGDASTLRQRGAKALVVLKGFPDTGRRGLSFWVQSPAKHVDHDHQSHGEPTEDPPSHPAHQSQREQHELHDH